MLILTIGIAFSIGAILGYFFAFKNNRQTQKQFKIIHNSTSLAKILSTIDKNLTGEIVDCEGVPYICVAYGALGIKLTRSFRKEETTYHWNKISVEFYYWKDFFDKFPNVIDDVSNKSKVLIEKSELEQLKEQAALVTIAERELNA